MSEKRFRGNGPALMVSAMELVDEKISESLVCVRIGAFLTTVTQEEARDIKIGEYYYREYVFSPSPLDSE